MSRLPAFLIRIRDAIIVSDEEEFEAGRLAGEEGDLLSEDSFFIRRVGWLVGRYARLEKELETVRNQTPDRILAAKEDVWGETEKRRKLDEQRWLEIIKHWRERALTAEALCHDLGHTIVPPEIWPEGRV